MRPWPARGSDDRDGSAAHKRLARAALAAAARRGRRDGLPLHASDRVVPRDARPARTSGGRRWRRSAPSATRVDGPARARDEPRRARPCGAADRLRAPGGALFIVKGTAAWSRRHAARRKRPGRLSAAAPCRKRLGDGYGGARGRQDRRRAPARAGAPHLPARRRALPVGPAGRDRAGSVRRRRRAVPDDVLPHLPPSRRRGLAARGGRRSGALERGDRRRSGAPRRARAGRPRSRCGSAASWRRGETGNDGGASLDSGIGGSRNPGALKCLHAHVAYALANPGYRLGEAMLAEIPERWPSRCCTAGCRSIAR